MTATATVDALLGGPRGRRMLLEFARACEPGDAVSTPLNHAVFWAVRALTPRGHVILFGGDGTVPEGDTATAADVARALDATALVEPTPRSLRAALALAVDAARYWQEPDGEDLLAATEEVRRALWRVAEHVASSTAPWWEPFDPSAQWAVRWDDERLASPTALPEGELGRLRDRMIAEERRAQRERPSDPAANMSGEWWSTPHWPTPSTAGEAFDGSPATLWFAEDSMGWERAYAHPVVVAPAARICEIDSAAAWGELCARFPIAVTAQRRQDWYRATGRSGDWVLPDWAAVAEHYDGVHLQAGAYLAAAGTAIEVGADTASVIAGWNPDETYWLTSAVEFGEPVAWAAPDDGEPDWRLEG